MTDAGKTGKKVPLSQAMAYGFGSMGASLLGWGMGSLFPIFNLLLGVSPALISVAQALPRVVDLFTDPFAGYLSDSLRRKYSRGHFVAAGSVVGGVFVALLWLFPLGMSPTGYFVWILIFTCISYVALSFMAVPLQALGFEMTGDANERTKLMAFAMVMGSPLAILGNWVYVFAQSSFFGDTIKGARYVGGAEAVAIIVFGLIAAFGCEGKSKREAAALAPADRTRAAGFRDFVASTKRVGRNRPYIILITSIIMMLFGLFGGGMCCTYLYIYYMKGGDQAQGMVMQAIGLTGYFVGSLGSTPIVLWLSRKIGKKEALLVFLCIALVGTGLKWIVYSKTLPYLIIIPPTAAGIGYTALWVLTASMMADTSDLDESVTGNQDAGMFSAFYLWTIKLGTSVALAISGILVSLTGFNVAFGAAQSHRTIMLLRIFDLSAPAVSIAVAMVLISRYPITAAQMVQVQETLNQRRALAALANGSGGPADPNASI
jgi:GPH family glycoside/pentoside/hexuronide:cation symporter